MVVKLDFSKAYDRVCQLHLRLKLIHLGLCVHFVNLVMSYMTIVSFSILINGYTLFKLRRALRQGCSLSPLFFLIFDEGLSKALIEAKRTRTFKGMHIGMNFLLFHLLFVDDILFCYDGGRKDATKLK